MNRCGVLEGADSMPAKLFSKNTQDQQPELIAETRELIRRQPRQGVAAALLGMAERPDVTSWLSRIDVPTLPALMIL